MKNKQRIDLGCKATEPKEVVEPLNDIAKRRSALAKIGKFSAYAIPTTIAIVTSTAAHAS